MNRDRTSFRRHRFRLRRFMLLGLVILISLVYYAFRLEPRWLQVQTVTVPLSHLDPAFDGYRIAQLSDLHIDAQMPDAYMANVIQTVNRQKPDLVVITGDFVTDNPQDVADRLTHHLSQLKAPNVAVFGNHDHWSNPVVIRDILRRSRTRLLVNSVTTVQRNTAQLYIAGVDDVWAGRANLRPILKQLPQNSAAILLAHEPDFADVSAATHRFGLQLSGHSHGGQVRVPGFKPPVLPPFGRRYPVGQYQIGDMIQYTNRGIGMVRPRVRFGSRPEITLLKLSAP